MSAGSVRSGNANVLARNGRLFNTNDRDGTYSSLMIGQNTDGVAIQAPGLARRPARQGPRMQAPSTARPYPLNPVSADASSASDEMAA